MALSGGICTVPFWAPSIPPSGSRSARGSPSSSFVEKVISPRIIEKYDYFMEHRGILITFILFVIPGFPKDALSYMIGLSHMKTSTFLIVCTAGRLLGTIMLSISGYCARNGQNITMATILGISALIVILAVYYHDELLSLVKGKKDSQ